MCNVRNFTTPKDAWDLCVHFVGNSLLTIYQYCEDEDWEEQDKKRIIFDNWANLAGNLYMIMFRLSSLGFLQDASNMQKILDMVVLLDLENSDVHSLIYQKIFEFVKKI